MSNDTLKSCLNLHSGMGRVEEYLSGRTMVNMENRISRKDDESLYQPKIHSRRIRTLYNIKKATGKPMTVILDRAIGALAENNGAEYHLEEDPMIEEIREEIWEDICEYRKLLDEWDYLKYLAELAKTKNH